MSEENTTEPVEVLALPALEITPGIKLSELRDNAEAFYNDFDPAEHDEADMVSAHTWAADLASTATMLKKLSSGVFVKWMEHRGRTCPVLEPKSKTPKGSDRIQKRDEDGEPLFKFWPAEVVFNNIRFMAKHKSDVDKKMSPGDMLEFLLDQSGGDFDQVAACLSSGAWKQGEVRTSFGEEVWDKCFEKTETTVLDDGTPRKRELAEVNTYFIDDALRRRASMDADREKQALK